VQDNIVVLKEIDYFKNNNWSLDPLHAVERELHWRHLTSNPPLDAILAGYSANQYYDLGQSDLNRMVIDLPYDFTPSLFSWPVFGIDVSLVETGCYERELIALCLEYGAVSVTLHEHLLPARTVSVTADITMEVA